MEALLEELGHDPEEARRERQAARRRKMLVIGLVLLAAAVPAGVWYEFAVRRSELCKGADQDVAKVWNPQTKAKVRDALLATGVSYANDTAERVLRFFDAYATSWMQMFTEACRATRVGGGQSVEVMDLRMSCLRRRQTEMRALKEVLAEADAAVVKKAVQAAAGPTPIAGCADIEALTAPIERIKPPPDKETAKKVESIRERLLKAKGLNDTGKYTKGLQLAEVLVAEAKTLNYLPVEAEALYWVGYLQDEVGHYEDAARTLESAFRSASVSHHDEMVAGSTSRLVWVVGYRLAKHEEGLGWARFAQFAEHSPAVSDAQKARRLNSLGIVFWRQGEYAKALEHYRKSLAIYEKALGPEHPDVAYPLMGMADVFKEQGECDKALEYYRKALAINEKALGAEHPFLAESLSGMGNVFVDQGMPEQALEPLERVVSLCEKKTCNPDHYGSGLFALARALVATDRDNERAIRLTAEAREVFGKTPKAFKKKLEEVNAWLKERRAE